MFTHIVNFCTLYKLNFVVKELILVTDIRNYIVFFTNQACFPQPKHNGKSIIRKWVNFHRVLRHFNVIPCDCACTGWPSLTDTNTTTYASTFLTTCGQSINNHHPLLWREVATISSLLSLRSNLPRGCFPSLTEEPVIIHWLGDPGWVLSVWSLNGGIIRFIRSKVWRSCGVDMIVTGFMR